jgi:hypothetical protein
LYHALQLAYAPFSPSSSPFSVLSFPLLPFPFSL